MRLRPSPTASISAVTVPLEYTAVSPSSASTTALLSTDAPSESARSTSWTSSARIAAKSGVSGGSAGGGAAEGSSSCCAIAFFPLSRSCADVVRGCDRKRAPRRPGEKTGK